MSQIHVSKDGNCVYCGAILKECVECGKMFHAMRINHIICSTRCRKNKERKKAAIKRLIEILILYSKAFK